ncbi:NAD(P)H-dependent flavin oxidoreductase [Jannaschia sp. CCS1]|uniref:NAD(P)H-dependent flavin oxidoreductase n=1 Tax=Jannaschia sp. (strain CCS1) TaxID=290400 RepID=UPI000053ABD5|nr:nitronate monooxygenase [Jannaschia sp. CCS1]ABD56893.1 2-nitropropane dioxygenase NPD [Jannaschia sp. CCS1]
MATRFTKTFGLKYPLAQAGMAFAGAEPDLAIAVCKGGGIGSIGVGFTPGEVLRGMIGTIRAATDAPFNINFITCFGNDEQVRVAAEEKVPVVSFHWGHPPADQIKMLKDAGCSIWVQVGTVEDGLQAVDYGADVIVAQGWEAGGHNYGGMGSMALIPAMVDAVGDRAMVLASGGISDARAAAAAMVLGADGVWVGTRLVASTEATVHREHHARLVAASGTDTTRSAVFGPEMPHFNPMRLLKVRVTEEFEGRLQDVPMERDNEPIIGETLLGGQKHIKRRFDVILPTEDTTGDFEEMAWLAGQGVGQVRDIKPAAQIVEEMMDGANDLLNRMGASIPTAAE